MATKPAPKQAPPAMAAPQDEAQRGEIMVDAMGTLPAFPEQTRMAVTGLGLPVRLNVVDHRQRLLPLALGDVEHLHFQAAAGGLALAEQDGLLLQVDQVFLGLGALPLGGFRHLLAGLLQLVQF